MLFNQSVAHELGQLVLLTEFKSDSDYVIYNDSSTLIRNRSLLEYVRASLNAGRKPIYSSDYRVDTSKFADSGRYYCLYSNKETSTLIKSLIYAVYDGKVVSYLNTLFRASQSF